MKSMMPHFHDMLDYAVDAVTIAASPGDTKARKLAIERCLEVIGEAAKRVPREQQPTWPMIPWKEVIDLRNAISHEYEIFSLARLERIVAQDMPPLIDALKNILSQHGE